MHRRDLLALGAAGALAAPSVLRAAPLRRVLVVGAGAAGVIAAQSLQAAGLEVVVLEAASRWGGRIAKLTGLADFPIDSGAEWIHGTTDTLEQVFQKNLAQIGAETLDYRPRTYQNWHKNRLRDVPAETLDYAELKFRDTTWYDVFDRLVVQGLGDALHLNAEVTEIRHAASGVTATLRDGRQIDADSALITVPLSVLQGNGIRFTPPLPKATNAGLNAIAFGSGYKVFLRFAERFYPDVLIAGPLQAFISDSWTEKTFYDAAFGKPSRNHVLGLFSAAPTPLPRAKLSDAALISDVLRELDSIYDGAASPLFLQGHAQNWSKTAFINGSYSMENDGETPISRLLAPLGNRVFFAGEALGGPDQATVQGAAFSAQRAVAQMLT